MSYAMKDVIEKTGLSAHTLRYYEKQGLLPAIERTQGGIRIYSDADLETLGLICCLKNTGMSLAEIAHFIRLTGEGPHTLRDRCEMLEKHQQAIREHIAEQQKYLEKVTCKIKCFSEKLEEYEKGQAKG